ASVLDMASRRVVGFALGEHHDAQLAYGALAMAVTVRGGQVPGVVCHTDQGSEYTAGMVRQAFNAAATARGASTIFPAGSLGGVCHSCYPVLCSRNGSRAREVQWMKRPKLLAGVTAGPAPGSQSRSTIDLGDAHP